MSEKTRGRPGGARGSRTAGAHGHGAERRGGGGKNGGGGGGGGVPDLGFRALGFRV